MRRLVISSVFTFVSIFCFAQAKWNCGVDGAVNVVAVFDGSTQTLVISGKGKMGDGSPWGNLKEAIKIVKINQGVTTIGAKAFDGLINLETVTIANSVTRIENIAFGQTSNLRKINIPSSVTYIGGGAFSYSGLESISLPYSVKDMGEYVFNGCSSLKTVDLSKTKLTYLYDKFFYKCEQLENIYLPSTMSDISQWVFAWCHSLKSITCFSLTPPKLPFWPFGSKDKDEYVDVSQITLYVPETSINVYKYSDVWKEFGVIEKIPTR